MSRRAGILSVTTAALVCACASSRVPDPGLEGLDVSAVNPGIVVEGTTIVVEGASFVGDQWGTSSLRLRGDYTTGSGVQEIDVATTAIFADFDRMEVTADSALFSQLPDPNGDFLGEMTIEVVSKVDGETYTAIPLVQAMAFRDELTPRLDTSQSGGVIFVNDPILVEGGDMLLGGDEGTTYAVLEGCFQPEGQSTCATVSTQKIPVVPDSPYDRQRGTFAFIPAIAGIEPGRFEGTVALENDHGSGPVLSSPSKPAIFDMIEPAVFSVSPTSASLGQYVDITGGGFVGGEIGSDTLLQLDGTYTPAGAGSGVPVNLLLVPEFVEGRTVRYVVNEDDALGQALDLRRDTGTFQGTLTPVVSYGGAQVTGSSTSMTLTVAPVRQILYLRFSPTYVESLRHYGLRAVDALVRERVREVVQRDYAGVNVDVRIEEPTDFALYSEVDIAGPDPNGLGLFGYDNTPGKDTGNERLYDRIGGVNAMTQEDGYPGFGGVFIESFFGFSMHPGSYAETLSGATESFDAIFDPFRPDQGGDPVRSADLSGGIAALTSGDSCPAASDRGEQVSCAVFVLGTLIGSTVSHEVGHSLGLANPYGEGFHNVGDSPNRLMDAGGARPFNERAELFGEGPSVFCEEAYEYLRDILPSSDPDPGITRPLCL